MGYVTINTDVEVYMDDFDDIDLVEELASRGYHVSKVDIGTPSINTLYDAWVYKNGNFDDLFRDFCRETIGRSF